ncbi:unnamed protein product, partial [Didymodactylos carnosus]
MSPRLYWLIYRRRNKLILLVAVVFCIGFGYFHNENNKRERRDVKITEKKEFIKGTITVPVDNKVYKKSRITAENYQPPPPCNGCPGEMGRGVSLTAEESKDLDAVMKKEFFNLKASDKVSLWRTIPDTRDGQCKSINYPPDMPTASVVIVFKNERWSPVLRTVYSVINRSPRHLLKEVILVDDQSDIEEMGKRLDDYCEENFGDLVKILRAPSRLGLIKAKNYGGKTAVGDVIIFLDAHCEANQGW